MFRFQGHSRAVGPYTEENSKKLEIKVAGFLPKYQSFPNTTNP